MRKKPTRRPPAMRVRVRVPLNPISYGMFKRRARREGLSLAAALRAAAREWLIRETGKAPPGL